MCVTTNQSPPLDGETEKLDRGRVKLNTDVLNNQQQELIKFSETD